MDNKKLVAGILTAVAAGIAISLVLNTKKGRQTSRRLMKKGNLLKDDLKGKFNDFIDQIEGKVQGILK
jgi:gas vesicle protein